MLRIFNIKTKTEIIIDDSNELIQLSPKVYDIENPHIDIELKNFDFISHSHSCISCKSFIDSLGTTDLSWFIEANNTIYRINLLPVGNSFNKNQLKIVESMYFQGTKLRLLIFYKSIEELNEELKENEKNESYEKCDEILKQIKELNATTYLPTHPHLQQ